MARSFTPKDLVDFVMKNRRGNAFKYVEEDDLIAEILNSLKEGVLIFCTDKESEYINGLGIGRLYKDTKVVFVTDTLCIEPHVLDRILQKFKDQFPGWKLEAKRHGKWKKYGEATDKFIAKVNSFTKKGII